MIKILMECLGAVFKRFLGLNVTQLTACLILLFTLSPAGAHQIIEGSNEDAEKQQMEQIEQVLYFAEQISAINAGLAGTAKAMAKALSDKKFRQFLRQQTTRSKNAEQILEAKAFFSKAMRTNRSAPGIEELQQRVLKLSAQVKAAGLKQSEQTGEVDIYFPDDDHRKRWRGSEDLLVAFVPLVDDISLREVYAWSAKDQKRVIIDAQELPKTPVLVIALTEKLTYATRKPPPPTDEGSVKGPEPKGKPKSDNSKFGASHLYIVDDQEPAILGDPEIYAYHIQLGAPTLSMNKHGYGDCLQAYTDLYWIVDENSMEPVWYYTGRYFDSRYSDQTYIIFMERDWNPRTYHAVQLSQRSTNTSERSFDGKMCVYRGSDFRGDYFGSDDEIWRNWTAGNLLLTKSAHSQWSTDIAQQPQQVSLNRLWLRKEH